MKVLIVTIGLAFFLAACATNQETPPNTASANPSTEIVAHQQNMSIYQQVAYLAKKVVGEQKQIGQLQDELFGAFVKNDPRPTCNPKGNTDAANECAHQIAQWNLRRFRFENPAEQKCFEPWMSEARMHIYDAQGFTNEKILHGYDIKKLQQLKSILENYIRFFDSNYAKAKKCLDEYLATK